MVKLIRTEKELYGDPTDFGVSLVLYLLIWLMKKIVSKGFKIGEILGYKI